MNKPLQPRATGSGMDESHIHKACTSYSPGYKPKPTGQGKSKTLLGDALREVFTNKPSTVKTSLSGPKQRKQMIAIAYAKARASGARLPRKK